MLIFNPSSLPGDPGATNIFYGNGGVQVYPNPVCYPVSFCMLATMQKTASMIFVDGLEILRRVNSRDASGRVVPVWNVVIITSCNCEPSKTDTEKEVENRMQSGEHYDVSTFNFISVLPTDRMRITESISGSQITLEVINRTDGQTRSITNVITGVRIE